VALPADPRQPVQLVDSRDLARARAAGMPATPFEVTVADVLAWDRDRGEPPLDTGGFSPAQEQAVLSQYNGQGR
jgi:hypothetical protein